MMVWPGTRKDQQGTKEKVRNQREKLHQKNQTLGTFYQPLCIMEEGEEEMGSQEREHKKEEEKGNKNKHIADQPTHDITVTN